MADSLRPSYVKATQAFLRKDYVPCLLEIEKALESAHEGSASSLEQLMVLRFTALYAVYAHAAVRQRVSSELHQTESVHSHKVEHMLDMKPTLLFIQLWYECVYALAQVPSPETLPSSIALTPVAEQVLLRMPTSVLSSAILMALRMDNLANADALQTTPSQNARQVCECFFSAVVQAEDDYQDMDKYERILRLYAIQVLGTSQGEWDYASNFVEYSTLPPPVKQSILEALSAAHDQASHRVMRESELLHHAQKHYESERSKRDARQDTQPTPAAPVPVPTPTPNETVVRPTVQRTPSIRARPSGLQEEKPSPSSHADQRQHLQQYLQRRPSTVPWDGPVQRPATWWSFFLSHMTRQRTLATLVVIAMALFLRSGSGPRPSSGTWPTLIKQRILDTIRMATQVTYL
ncbi:hypothetical protein MNAN1_001707 [Malassezia nana]|uniref:Uncharacterized protein n=1 Tax=Malassezia nana TaxID=180528 RepID=A0AAF0J272_9BASI|nr:hypothetical protein MNAN1_001707 [Malassezia nana]